MADISRAASHHATLTTTPGWGEIDQALGKLDVRSDKDKHVRLDKAQVDLHVHDSQGNPHGLGSPKKKFERAVVAIKSAIDRDFGPGSGDLVFRNIGIKKNSEGLKLKQIDALRQEVANLTKPIDQASFRKQLESVNHPKLGPVDLPTQDRGTAKVSGQMLRDKYPVDIGKSGSTSDSNEVVARLGVATGGKANHVLALSNVLSQMTPIALKAADPTLQSLKTEIGKAAINFALERSPTGYTVDVEYEVGVTGRGHGMDIEESDPSTSRVTMQATMHIPFAAIDGQGNIDASQIGFDQQKPPRYDLTFNPL